MFGSTAHSDRLLGLAQSHAPFAYGDKKHEFLKNCWLHGVT